MALVRDGKIAGQDARRSTMDPATLVREMSAALFAGAGLSSGDGVPVVATGVGRKNVPGASQVTDFTSFAKGARALHPSARIVIDLGGQGMRLMELDANGLMTNFVTNDKCSTGTGCFLDIMAAALKVEPALLGITSLEAKEPAVINTTCTVFAESEVVSLVARKRPKEEIIAGLHDMVAKKIGSLIVRLGTRGDLVLVGGVARNVGVVRSIERELKRTVTVPENPHMVGALGAALSAPGGTSR